jgi:chemosensory pili system protein ChpC
MNAETNSAPGLTEPEQISVRSLLIPVEDGYLLVPGSVVAEVISFSPPETIPGDTPNWLLGRFDWRGQRIPCISFEGINGSDTLAPASRARLVVLKALGDRPDLAHFAMVAQGIPRLVTVSARGLEAVEDDIGDAPAIITPVLAQGEPAFIPNMRYMEDRIYRALYG